MNATNKALSIVAFYLSEYDMKAVKSLGFRTRNEAITSISTRIGSGNNYLKLRRDEFDALPDSSSSRKGWRNRPPLKEVSELAAYLHQFSFEDLTGIVKSLIGADDENNEDASIILSVPESDQISEEELERIINYTDPSAQITLDSHVGTHRVYNRSIVNQLKKLYRGSCQICGTNPVAEFNVNICEAHHIEYFSASQNNNASNIIILCPNHHKLVHKLNLQFNYNQMTFQSNDSIGLPVRVDYHLNQER